MHNHTGINGLKCVNIYVYICTYVNTYPHAQRHKYNPLHAYIKNEGICIHTNILQIFISSLLHMYTDD